MGWFVNEDLVPVELECRCPSTPHDKDTVFLFPTLTVEGGIAVEALASSAVNGDIPTGGAMSGMLGASLLQHGIARWTFVDETGKGIPATPRNIALFSRNWAVAQPVAEKADEIYAEAVLAPLVKRLSKLSPTSRTGGSTSRRRAGSKTRPRRSRSSTTATSRPSLQVMTSSGSDSSSSPKRQSATG